ncbi:MAG: response regulator [Spirochaetes bacterium]|nr:response regulator [Spirochaetota bacterium]
MAQKILLVDDDKDLVQSLSQALSTKGFDVEPAYSGAEGLKKLLAVKPDLIILDVMMETDTAGFEAAYQIRSDRETSKYKEVKNIPIIILTAINQVTNSRFSLNQKESFLPSINEFLTKPIDIDELIAKVERSLK